MNSMKRQKDLTPKDEPPNPQVSKCPKYTTGEEPRNGYRKNEEAEPKWKRRQLWLYLVVKVNCDAVKNNIA